MKKPLRLIALLLTAAATQATMAAGAPAAAAPKADLAKGQAISTQVCAACHSADGSRGSPANPIIAGQHPEYLAKQLADFKEGKRKSAVMQGFAGALSADDMRNVAAFYGSKTAKPGAAKNKDTVALGQAIYRGGIAARGVPACAACHSPNGAGLPVQFPRVGGQHADYTEAQLNAFRSGARVNAQMSAIAAKMNDKEIKAVSDYIAGLN
ncbi:cytochrome c553 [Inhella inkyongensis]|uniref:Cytochrome c553 n=1 Tax=Inhella inkyongensis TaxID=392593 RepID=A0A840S341_9BURK|nr:c-type cytochrome [Inhella inkyongensis]MBB5203254.1 cytochrome c553 [Inhella inkyongensis]